MVERRYPTVEEARKVPKIIATSEFVGRVNSVAGRFDNLVEVLDLRPMSKSALRHKRELYGYYEDDEALTHWNRYLERFGFKEGRDAPDGWDDFWSKLEATERSYLSASLNLVHLNGFRYVGNVREADFERLTTHVKNPSEQIGSVRAAFLKGIFEPRG